MCSFTIAELNGSGLVYLLFKIASKLKTKEKVGSIRSFETAIF